MATIGYATLPIIPSMKGAQAALTAEGALLGGVVGKALLGGLGLVIGGGAVLLGVGSNLQDAFATIRTEAGLTGDALQDTYDRAKATWGKLPGTLDDSATAYASLNTRLGLLGDDLDVLAPRFLELSRITGTDLTGNIASVTRAFGDWGVGVDAMPGRLDSLFRASQATGIPVAKLADQLVQFGAPMRQLGFDMDSASILFAKFEREGVNAELVMGSLRIALGKLAAEGKNAPEAFALIADEIASMEDPTAASALAIELFGRRAGADMAAALREGRFSIAELYDVVAGGEETILAAADASLTLGDKWDRLTNQMTVKFAPAIEVGIDVLDRFLTTWSDKGFSEGIAELIGRNPDDFTRGWAELTDLWETRTVPNWNELTGPKWDSFWPRFQDGALRIAESTGAMDAAWTAANLWQSFHDTKDSFVDLSTTIFVKGQEARLAFGRLQDEAADLWAAFTAGPDLLKAAWSGGFDFLSSNLRIGLNSMASIWNALEIPEVGGWEIPLPAGKSLTLGPWGPWPLPDLPTFDRGGVVPGPRGMPQLIVAHGGETVLPTHKGDAGITVHQTFNEAADPYETAEVSNRMLMARIRPRSA